MENKRLDKVIEFGKTHSGKTSAFDIVVSKLLTAITIMPSLGYDYDFVVDDGKTSLEVFKNDVTNHDNELIKINYSVFDMVKVLGLIEKIYDEMKYSEKINGEQCMFKIDQILWSALDNSSSKVYSSGYARTELLKSIDQKTLQLDTFRRIVSKYDSKQNSNMENLLTTTLATINYYSNGNENKFENMAVNDRTFYYGLEDIKSINRSINFCAKHNDNFKNISDTISARSDIGEIKASYLSGVYFHAFKDGNLRSSSEIDVDKCQRLIDAYSRDIV